MEQVTSTENQYQELGAVAVANLTIWFSGLWNRFAERMWKILGLWAREALEHCKQSLVGHSGGISEYQNA